MSWTVDSWKKRPASQQARYDDPAALDEALARLSALPPVVTSWEIEKLKAQLAQVARGERFLLQGGDCSERFDDCRSEVIDAKLKILLKMSLVLMHAGGREVVRVGRIAGQYAKPRSSDTETRDGLTLPSYRGDLVNRPEFTAEARRADPANLLEGYARSAMTINFIRSLLAGGFGDLHNPEVWNLDFVDHTEQPEEYQALVTEMGQAIRFLETVMGRSLGQLGHQDFYTSHEGLHLPYEAAVSEVPPLRSRWYDLGTHFPWIGARTATVGGAHVEFFRGIANPIGVKVGPELSPEELVELVRVLDPHREPGRLTLIHRLGADRIEPLLPPLVEAVLREGATVVWCCDPMHANTYLTDAGLKTRRFDDILAELDHAFEVHEGLGSILGGVHFEMTGEDVTEVVGGARGLAESELPRAYGSDIDPRLNYEQALEMAFLIARRMRRR